LQVEGQGGLTRVTDGCDGEQVDCMDLLSGNAILQPPEELLRVDVLLFEVGVRDVGDPLTPL